MTSTQQKMDDAADEARQELHKVVERGEGDADSVLFVAAWIKKNYLNAGYKRLCKVLMQEAGVK